MYLFEWVFLFSSDRHPRVELLVSMDSSVQSLSRVWLFATPWTAARQAYLSITISQSLLKLMSIELVMWSVSFLRSSKTVKMKVSVAQLHLTLCRPVTVAQYAPHPWNSPGKNNTVGCHSLLQGIFLTPWTAAHQASLSFTISQSLLKLMSIESVMPSNQLILCHPLYSCFQSSIFQDQGPLKWISSSNQVAKRLKFQL